MEKTNNKKPIIEVNNLNLIYNRGKSNEILGLKDISIKIYPEEYVIFFGASGSGKSTLLFSIAGLETRCFGEILIEGINIKKMNKKQTENFHQNVLGMVYQEFYLIDSLTVLKNTILPQIAIGVEAKERKRRAIALLERFGVKEQANKYPSEISGGQKQRVSICRAVINDPTIIFADEPVGNLDSRSSDEVMQLLSELNSKYKKTVVLVTHNQQHLDNADRIFFIKDGRVIREVVQKKIKNIEAKSIVNTVVPKDLEILARSFPSMNTYGSLLTPYKAKEIVQEAITGLSYDEVRNLEKVVESALISNENRLEKITELLDADEKRGGLAMHKTVATNLAQEITDIINEIEQLQIIEKESKLDAPKEEVIDKMTNHLMLYIINKYDLDIKYAQKENNFYQIIFQRMSNELNSNEVFSKLDLPINDGGAGLDRRIARRINKHIELIILGKFNF